MGRQLPQREPAAQRAATSSASRAPAKISARMTLSFTAWQWQTTIGSKSA
jgi:hypothetical protein